MIEHVEVQKPPRVYPGSDARPNSAPHPGSVNTGICAAFRTRVVTGRGLLKLS